MAKIYDVYDDFNEEMRNISHFFNLNYNEKKISNEEFIFNFLEQQVAEKKIADCISILKEQNKSSKKEECPTKKDEQVKTTPEMKKDKKILKPSSSLKKEDKIVKNTTEKKSIKTEEVSSSKESLKIEKTQDNTVNKDKNITERQGKNFKIAKDVEEKISTIVDVVKENFEKAAKQLKIKKENETQEKIVTFVKNDRDVDFERRYLQNGKYVIDGVNIETSVFGKKTFKINTVEKNSEEQKKDFDQKKPVVPEVTKNKKFKIDCNIDQNLLNGCYWPTQLS